MALLSYSIQQRIKLVDQEIADLQAEFDGLATTVYKMQREILNDSPDTETYIASIEETEVLIRKVSRKIYDAQEVAEELETDLEVAEMLEEVYIN